MFRRPSAGLVISLIALFIAMNGLAWAATRLERNSVESRHIAPGQVQGSDVRNDSIEGTDIDESSLEGRAITGIGVHRPARVEIDDDPDTPGPSTVRLIETDTFLVEGSCLATGDPEGARASIQITSVTPMDVFSLEGASIGASLRSATSATLVNAGPVNPLVAGTYAAHAESGSALHGSALASVAGSSACAFSASGIGS